ncbi:MAG: helix-turn-helix transcriptional regulator [Candidatus Aminicenantes bacterium]|nr:MAG: helix-turn-helix transcriptional regulator [Candidatus Aminicenantes bacterium]
MGKDDSELLKWVVRYIASLDDDKLGELTVTRLCRQLNISETYLYQIFRTKAKIGPGSFLTFLKIYRSRVLLRDKNMQVREVANKMGFSTVDYFIRLFKNYFKMTPGRYMRLVKMGFTDEDLLEYLTSLNWPAPVIKI